jgi:hypothetical protein
MGVHVDSSSGANDGGVKARQGANEGHETGWLRYNRNRHRVYLGILVFVVIGGLPMIAVPSIRSRLRTRIQVLRSAYGGEPAAQVPASAKVGENREPFPHEYDHPQPLASYLPKLEPSTPRQTLKFTIGGGDAAPPGTGTEPLAAAPRPVRSSGGAAGSAPRSEKGEPSLIIRSSAAAEPAGLPSADAGGEPQYRKGKSEQEAYDLLVNANQTLAGMIKGGDSALKFQDWSAANMGENSFYVMVTFAQAADNVLRKYIWSVKVATKEVIPLSAYAMSISK